jgi:hypothetical protein
MQLAHQGKEDNLKSNQTTPLVLYVNPYKVNILKGFVHLSIWTKPFIISSEIFKKINSVDHDKTAQKYRPTWSWSAVCTGHVTVNSVAASRVLN